MEYTRRKLMIIYILILFISFMLGSFILPTVDKISQYSIVCDDGEIYIFNRSDEWVCEGLPNPLHKDRIKTNLSLIIKNYLVKEAI